MIAEEGKAPSLEALRAGESAAWTMAYPALWNAARSVIAGKLSSPGDHDLDNLAADVIAAELMPGLAERRTQAFLAIATFGDLLKLARAIARNRVVDYLRARARRPEVLTDNPPEPLNEMDDSPDFTLEELMLRVETLPPPDPDLIRDRFVLGLTTAELAAKYGMNRSTVLSRFHRAFAVLRRRLDGARSLTR